jgi:hypothetical protein
LKDFETTHVPNFQSVETLSLMPIKNLNLTSKTHSKYQTEKAHEGLEY